jgi:hypothetical protein
MRLALVIASIALTGCGMLSGSKPELPKQPDAPTSTAIVEKVGAQQDKIDGRVAAAVAVASESADKPAVVKSELSVASAYLPQPSQGDLAFARQRAAKADAKDYADAVAYGKKLLASIDANWAKMEADTAEAKRVSGLKDARIEELQKEIVKVRQEASRNIFTLLGAGLIAAGALACAFVSFRIGGPLIICGAFAGAVPFIIESPWFPWVSGGTAILMVGIGCFLIWERYIKAPIAVVVHDPNDEQAPKV